jgi:hypothetical protein
MSWTVVRDMTQEGPALACEQRRGSLCAVTRLGWGSSHQR